MGACSSKTGGELAAERLDSEIDRKNKADFEKEASKIKLLLLGAGESGKSTIFKQMRILYGKGYSVDDRRQMVPVVFNNTITSMKALTAACTELGYPIEHKEAAAAFEGVSDEATIDPRVGDLVKTLWADAGIQRAFAERQKFQLNDSASYFFERIDVISAGDAYVPTVEDVLKTRVRTSGILEEEYVIDKVRFVIYDVGGQRNERRKWIHCFEEVTAVIFVAAISEYDQVLFEDNAVNRLVEALNLFEEVCSSRWFENTSIILFLNKSDIFAEKIRTIDLRQPNMNVFAAEKEPVLFADYDGGCDYDAAVHYILAKFLERNRNPKREIFYQITCATDTDNVNTVFHATKDIILKHNLTTSGFME